MPLPSPHLNDGENPETEQEFVSRCAGDPVMNEEFKDSKRRVAVCYSIYRRAKQKQGKANWSETVAEIERTGRITTEDTIRLIGPPGV